MKRAKLSRWAYVVAGLSGAGVFVPVSMACALAQGTFSRLTASMLWWLEIGLCAAALLLVGVLFGRWQPSRAPWLGGWVGLPLALIFGPLNVTPSAGEHDTKLARMLAAGLFVVAGCVGARIGAYRHHRKRTRHRRRSRIYHVG